MTLNLPDDLLREAGISEADARIEFACSLFDAGRLELWPAARMAGLSRLDMEDELHARNLPVYRPTVADFEHDLDTIRSLRA